MVKISAEELVKASLPWQGMGGPERDAAFGLPSGQGFRISRWARPNDRQNPWDNQDSTQGSPVGVHLAAIPSHAPPEIPGDGDPDRRQTDPEPSWFSVIHTPSMPAIGPAFYAHGSKPAGYYTDSHPQSQGFGSPGTPGPNGGPGTFLQLAASAGASRPSAWNKHPAARRLRGASAYRHKRPVGTGAAADGAPLSFLQLSAGSPGESATHPITEQPQSAVPFTPNKAFVFDGMDADMIRRVTGDSKYMLPPRETSFNYFHVNNDPNSPDPPMPHHLRHPPTYQPAPAWPPAPPEPLFPLKTEDAGDSPQPPPPMPGPAHPFPSGADFGHFQTPGQGTPYIGDQSGNAPNPMG